MSQMLIANRLQDGLTVFLTRDGSWVETIQAGWLIEDSADCARALRQGKAAEIHNAIIGPELIDVEEQEGRRTPVSMREAIRASGPTVQAGNHGAANVPVR
jgi:hypothetical protein